MGAGCIAALLASSTHLVLIEHRWCAVHGELEHGAHLQKGETPSERISRRNHSARQTFAANRAAGPHDHDECEAFSERRDSVIRSAPVARAAHLSGAMPGGEARSAEIDDAVCRYAPKTSPPA